MFYQSVISEDPAKFKDQILQFLNAFDDVVFLDSNSGTSVEIPFTGTRYDYIAAAGIITEIRGGENTLDQLRQFLQENRQKGNWVFGYLTYDMKNSLEALNSANPAQVEFPLFHFFVASHVLVAMNGEIRIISKDDPTMVWRKITGFPISLPDELPTHNIHFSHIPDRESYMKAVNRLLKHIQQGDIYEVNYCHEVVAKSVNLNPIHTYKRLGTISPNPFSCYYRTEGLHLMCASPERFITKRKNILISQPIKGTAPRNINPSIDRQNREYLSSSEKERSENIMIVDLVRNDLSKVSERGTVQVQELCGVYSFAKAHQMISTISCSLKPGKEFTDIIQAMFPMGSMTGAPKISAMNIIEEQESFRRSLFSGTVGYIEPGGDFDFNVVIRSILYREQTGILSIAAGSAITSASDPEKEFNETFVKLAPQLEALGLHPEMLTNEIADGKPA